MPTTSYLTFAARNRTVSRGFIGDDDLREPVRLTLIGRCPRCGDEFGADVLYCRDCKITLRRDEVGDDE